MGWHLTANSAAELPGVTVPQKAQNVVMVGMGQLPTAGKEGIIGESIHVTVPNCDRFFRATM